MELEEHEECTQSGSAAHGINVSNPPVGAPTLQKNLDVKASKSREREELHVIGERTTRDEVPFNDSVDVNQKDHAILSVGEETNPTAVEVVASIKQVSPRLHLPQIRSRDPSSSVEFCGDNKKLKMVCEFHAKGWCIRGSSCRFLHIKDGVDARTKRGEVLDGEASSSKCIPTQQSLEKDDHSRAPIQDGRGSFGHNLHLDTHSYYASPLVEDYVTGRNHFSHPGKPLSFGSSSWNTNSHGSRLRYNNFRDIEHINSMALFSFDWEPSAPFRPSHVITRDLLKENLYDPICDNIVKKDVGDGRIKFSDSDQGSSVKDVNVQSNSLQEEKFLGSVHASDAVKDNLMSFSWNDKLKHDKAKDETVLEVGEACKNNVIDDGIKQDSESKALKYFQFALIEFVKELVRPTWHKGLLSKDAHKLIVKKAVDKVISAFEPHQIPSTGESVKSYLSSCQPKLAKLVEAYIEKYGKT